MKFYQEITLIDQSEVSNYFILSKLFKQLHLAFVEQKKNVGNVKVGVSFPQYIYEPKSVGKKPIISLGKKLRIFSENENDLKSLDLSKWLERYADYLHISSVRGVPSNITGYATYGRKQVLNHTEAQRLVKRRVERGEVVTDDFINSVIKTTDLPYIEMLSDSSSTENNKKLFKLFIEKKLVNKSDNQVFSTYGLSSESPIPEF